MAEQTPAAAGTRTVRFGYHGSTEVVDRIVRLAGRGEGGDEVRLIEYDIADPFRGVRAGELDVMIAKFPIREPDLVTSRVLTEDARAVVVASGHPLAARTSVSIEELADFDAFAPPGSFPGYVWDDVVPPYTPAGRPVRRVRRVATVPEMMRTVAAGDAVHISLTSLADIAPPGITVVPIHDLPPAPVTLAWLRGAELHDHVREFITTAEAEASR
ncbi:LysR substrate-binding domain-containing protein [Streptomyces sp. NBC_00083]|uniref:LysR substrate-binding domain-containing protein n=1 Tax=Streptomyces sp. NBC_00083 TaxID=2975647 RepID=UPI00224E19E2|nr:LysR substrate-binding domain-containing protein [Streptomyces sp. NBC_00083]MCX5388039.1 LysR substrate-binding domain-containing protein [Streptomyces sp. NBC_00083]